jgi:hypothetical protein
MSRFSALNQTFIKLAKMKTLLLSFLVVFGPLAGTACLFARTVRREFRNLGGQR